MLSQKHLQLLEKRGIQGEMAERLGYDSSGENLMIPYVQGGKTVGKKYRTLEGDKKFFQEKGSAQIFYNFDALMENTDENIVITEGEFDCAIALQCGFLAVSVPNGAPMTPVQNGDTKYAYLQHLPANRTIILATDDDAAGWNLRHDLSRRIGQHRCKWVKYPEGCKDLNEAYLQVGVTGIVEIMNRAQWTKIDGIFRMSELPEPPYQEPFDCPVSGTGGLYKLRGGDLAIITGIPGLGKTTLVNEIMAACTTRYQWNVAVASFEQSPKLDHRRSLRTYFHSVPADRQSETEVTDADSWIDNKFTFIVPDDDDEVNLKWVLDKCEAAILRNHCKLIVIDPWNEMDHDAPPGMSLTQYTGFAIKQFKKLARKHLVHLIVIAHPAKLHRNKDGTYPTPSLYDISDSAHWYNKPDMGIVVHRLEDGDMLFRVQKCRYVGVIGKIGEVKLKYDREKNLLSEQI